MSTKILLLTLLLNAKLVGAQTGVSAETVVFERARHSVFVIETESGYGSGFLVDGGGLIVTNDHVIRNTRYLAVGVTPERKYPAVVVMRDVQRDVALIRVHSQAVAGCTPLPFSGSAAAVVGQRVLAVGSALTDDGALLTAGVISRVTPETIITDLNVNAGSSGGPLLNLDGGVLGITTFYLRAPTGPGLAGVVRAPVVQSLLSTLRPWRVEDSPELRRLPVASPRAYPAASLAQRAKSIRSLSDYGTRVGPLHVDVLTPPVVFYESHQAQIRASQDMDYVWRSRVGRIEAIVGIRVNSDGSDFMRLLRGGVEVEPIVPGRFCESGSADRPAHSRCRALYQFPPEAFAPGAQLELHLSMPERPGRPYVWKLPDALVRRVWADFEPWRQAASRPN